MRGFVLFILFSATLISCTKEPILDIREGMSFNPDTLLIESSESGWELYSWQADNDWRFSLVVATSRYKTTEEILANPFAVTGREQLKLLLRSLPAGEEITWYGINWIDEHIQGVTTVFVMPTMLTQYDIHVFCRENILTLSFVE